MAVLNTLNSADAKLGYCHAIDEFVDWHCSEPRLAFNRIVVLPITPFGACPVSRLVRWELARILLPRTSGVRRIVIMYGRSDVTPGRRTRSWLRFSVRQKTPSCPKAMMLQSPETAGATEGHRSC